MASEADLKMEIAISRMLRAGVSLAAIVVFVGGCLYMWQAHGVTPDYRHFHGIASPADRIPPLAGRPPPGQSQHHPPGHSATDRDPDHAGRVLRLWFRSPEGQDLCRGQQHRSHRVALQLLSRVICIHECFIRHACGKSAQQVPPVRALRRDDKSALDQTSRLR